VHPLVRLKVSAVGDEERRTLRKARTAAALVATTALALLALAGALPGAAGAKSPAKGATITVKTVSIGAPGNPSVAIVPFSDALYKTCAEAPAGSKECQELGSVDYRYGIGQLEVTVGQWVRFLNVVDPLGKDPHNLYDQTQSPANWPKYGEISELPKAAPGKHYRVGYPEWKMKPFGFTNFLRAARFVNSLYNGTLLSKQASSAGSFKYVTYKVRLSTKTETGMYNLAAHKRTGATRAKKVGFVLPSQDEWVKSAYYDPNGGGTYSYWKYPTNAGQFGAGETDAPNSTTLTPTSGEVTNPASQPLANFHAKGLAAPSWCPAAVEAQICSSANPFGLEAEKYALAYQGSLSTVGQALTPSPWGTLEQGGNAVEWTDTITKSPFGNSDGRVWRRMHGGVPNAPAYQLWISAVGLEPQDNPFFDYTYPWLGFRVGVIGNLKVAKH
jgi:hypothetical protein